MIKSELSVAFTGWRDDIDETDDPGAKEIALKTSTYGEMPQHLPAERHQECIYTISLILFLV